MNGAAAEFIVLLERQLELYDELRKLSGRQSHWVSCGDVGKVMDILAERQKVTADITSLGGLLQPWRQDWEQRRAEFLNDAEHDRVAKLLFAISDRVRDILRRDEADARILAARKGRTFSAMSAVQTGHLATTAYGRASAGAGVDAGRSLGRC